MAADHERNIYHLYLFSFQCLMEEQSLSKISACSNYIKNKNKRQETCSGIELPENPFTTAYNIAAVPDGGWGGG